MSQSAIQVGDPAEIKYKKALKQITMLMTTNRQLKENNEKSGAQFKNGLEQLTRKCEVLQKENERYKKQKDSVSDYVDQIQKERNNLERQVAYLNDINGEQNAQLKKINLYKDESTITTLIRSYEENEKKLRVQITEHQDLINKLKLNVKKLQNDVIYERNLTQDFQERNNTISFQISNYKDQNNSLLTQVERLLKESNQKDAFCVQKQKQLTSLMNELQKQISLLRNVQDESHKSYKSEENKEAYEQVLNEKNKQYVELNKMQSAYEQMLIREKEYYEMEQKMKSARMQAERANQEVNMLKSKIIVLEAKQFLQEAGDDDNQKYFQERLNILAQENDPLTYIRNNQDSTHFKILKSFIVDLQDKIYRITTDKKQINRKYKSLKTKFVKNAQDLTHLEEQNKTIRGKLQGFERLTQKLQFQLQRTLANSEEEISRMALTSNNLITRKVQEYKNSFHMLTSQLEMTQDKANRTEKNFKQEIQTLKLQLDTIRIKYKDQTDKTNKDTELIQLYKKKINELANRVSALEDQLVNSTQNLYKYEQLFKQQKSKNQGLISQKQQLMTQTRQLTEELDKKSLGFNTNFKMKEDQYEFEFRKLRTDNQRMKEEIEANLKQINILKRDADDIHKNELSEFGQVKRLTQRNAELESKIIDYKRSVRNLQDEIETTKIKNKKFQQNYERNIKFEEDNVSKNDRINDLVRQKIELQNEVKVLQGQFTEQARQNEQYKKQLSGLKIKSLESNHQSKRQFELKILECKKNIQSLNQDISDLTTELRDQKSKNMRLVSQLNNVKAEKSRLQELLDHNRKRDLQNEGQMSNMKLQLYNCEMEMQKLQSQIKNQQQISTGLNSEIENLQQKIFSQNQQLSSLKMKFQSAEDLKNDLVKDLNAIKVNFSTVQTHVNQARSNINLPWQEQSFYTSLSDILFKIRKISRNHSVGIESASSPVSGLTTASLSFPDATVQYPSVTNYYEQYRTYSDSNQDSGVKSSLSGTNLQNNRTSNFNINTNKFEYNFSNQSSSQNLGQSSTVYEQYRPSYEFNKKYDYQFSTLSNIGQY